MIREALEMELDNGIVEIKFKKMTGEIRVLMATRDLRFIPNDKQPKASLTRNSTSQQIRVYDVSIGDWRSFNYDHVISYTVNSN